MDTVPTQEWTEPRGFASGSWKQYCTELEAALAECYRLSGADPDDDDDKRLAKCAVNEVTRMRKELDESEAEILRLETALAKEKLQRTFAEDRARSAESFIPF